MNNSMPNSTWVPKEEELECIGNLSLNPFEDRVLQPNIDEQYENRSAFSLSEIQKELEFALQAKEKGTN